MTSFIQNLLKNLTRHSFIHSIRFTRSFRPIFTASTAGSFQLKYITLLRCPAGAGLIAIAPSLPDLWSFGSLSYTFRFDSAGLRLSTLGFFLGTVYEILHFSSFSTVKIIFFYFCLVCYSET